jgi:hypothetical protein
MKNLRPHLEIIPAQSGWYVLNQSTNTWLPIVGWRLSFNPDDPDCDHPITLPVVFGAWSPDDGYIVKSPEGYVGYVHKFEITCQHTGNEMQRINDCKAALQNAEWGEEFEESRQSAGKQEETLQ